MEVVSFFNSFVYVSMGFSFHEFKWKMKDFRFLLSIVLLKWMSIYFGSHFLERGVACFLLDRKRYLY